MTHAEKLAALNATFADRLAKLDAAEIRIATAHGYDNGKRILAKSVDVSCRVPATSAKPCPWRVRSVGRAAEPLAHLARELDAAIVWLESEAALADARNLNAEIARVLATV
jgi:hypothetical protein